MIDPKARRVLVVDDDEAVRTFMDYFLKQLGCEVFLANNGAEGLEMAKTKKPDLILLDIMMPDMKGTEVCEKLKKDALTKNIPVVGISGMENTGGEAKSIALNAGFDDFIGKKGMLKKMIDARRSKSPSSGR